MDINKQIIKSVIRSNTGAPENIISFVKTLPNEFCDCETPEGYSGYRCMSFGDQVCILNQYMAVSESTAYYRDRAMGRYFYTTGIYVLEGTKVSDIADYVSNKYNKTSIYKERKKI